MENERALDVPSRFVTVAVLLLASTTIMSNATIAPSLPGLKDHFADVEGIDTLAGLLLALPSLSILLTAGLFGWLADRVNRQPLLIIAGLLVIIGGGSGLIAQSLTQMLIGRVILGVGVGGTMTLAFAWAADLWQGPARARFMGLQGAAVSAGGVVALILGGALAAVHWRGAFAVYLLTLPITVIALMALAPYSRALQERRAAGERQSVSTADEPFPWGMYAFVGGLAFLFMTGFYIMPTRVPFHLTAMGTSNTLVIAAIMALVTLISTPGALLYGRMRRFLSPVTIFAMSFGLMAAGLTVVGLSHSVGLVALGAVLAGLGLGPSMPNFTTYFNSFVPPSQRGRAAGLLTTAFFAGQFASPLVSAPLVAWLGLNGAFVAMGMVFAAIAAGLAMMVMTRSEVAQAA
ncbi:MAG: MFS transporter [Deltaproteobacteria bacterium]